MFRELQNLADLIKLCQQNGWTATHADPHLRYELDTFQFNYVYLYPKRTLSDGTEETLDSIYITADGLDKQNLANTRERVLSRAKPIAEYDTGKLLELIATAQALSASLSLPADFINPLTAMAERLRSNILEHKPLEETPPVDSAEPEPHDPASALNQNEVLF